MENLKTERIGAISQGIDGSDEYLLVRDLAGDMTAEQLEASLTEQYFRDTDAPGGYFCYAVNVAKHPLNDGQFIAIVHHRYNV